MVRKGMCDKSITAVTVFGYFDVVAGTTVYI